MRAEEVDWKIAWVKLLFRCILLQMMRKLPEKKREEAERIRREEEQRKEEMRNPKDEETLQWIEWAKSKADWYDPTVSIADELLGEREPGKSLEEEKPQTRRWNWWE